MSALLLVWFLTVFVTMLTHIKYQLPLWCARRRLYEEFQRQNGFLQGFVSSSWAGLKVWNDPESIHDESDTPEMRNLKQAYIREREAVRSSFWKVIRIMFIGFGLTILTGILEAIWKGKP